MALSEGLKPGGVMRAVIGDTDIVVWRTADGQANAWNNRCPHRGMRLSFGFVRGDRLACLYHGWQFGPDSVCRYIPAHPDLVPPDTITATVYRVVESGGVIWVSLLDSGEPDIADVTAAPVRSIAVDAGVDQVRAALTGATFPVSADWQPGTGRFSAAMSGDAMVTIEGEAEGQSRTLFAALQPLPDGRTTVHLQISGDADAALRKRLSAWAERLRWFLENPGEATSSWAPATAEARAA